MAERLLHLYSWVRERIFRGVNGLLMNNDFFNLVNFWQAIRIYGWWQVGIELLIIGLFVYSIMRFLRGTAASA